MADQSDSLCRLLNAAYQKKEPGQQQEPDSLNNQHLQNLDIFTNRSLANLIQRLCLQGLGRYYRD